MNALEFDSQPRLQGNRVSLEPLLPEHFDPLYEVAADPEIWLQHPSPDRYKEPEFRAFFKESLESGGALVIRDLDAQAIIGSSRFHGFDAMGSEVEIGWTFMGRAYWGGAYNREVKWLMLEHAFRFVERVVFLVGPVNFRSRRAVEKIGAVLAGERHNEAGDLLLLYEIRADRFRANPTLLPEKS